MKLESLRPSERLQHYRGLLAGTPADKWTAGQLNAGNGSRCAVGWIAHYCDRNQVEDFKLLSTAACDVDVMGIHNLNDQVPRAIRKPLVLAYIDESIAVLQRIEASSAEEMVPIPESSDALNASLSNVLERGKKFIPKEVVALGKTPWGFVFDESVWKGGFFPFPVKGSSLEALPVVEEVEAG